MMLEENPLFHAAAVRSAERVPSGLQCPVYWKLFCFTDCWRHVAYATDDLGLILLLWRPNL